MAAKTDPDKSTDEKATEPPPAKKAAATKKAAAPKGEAKKSSKDSTIDRDPADLGVPMLPGSPGEPVGPEDALGEGPKRGDYSDRLGGESYDPHQGNEAQRPRVDDVGDEAGKKGGVETASAT